MDFADKAKETAKEAKDKAAEVASELLEKAGPLVEKAGELAAKGVDATATGLDKVTGGRFHDQIENVSSKVEGALDRNRQEKEDPKTIEEPKPDEG